MDFAFVVDPLPSLKAYKDSSVAMMRALGKRGHRVFALGQGDIVWDRGTVRARVRPLEVRDDDHDWYREGEAVSRRLADFAAVTMRKDPPFDMEYVYSTYLLEAAEREGALVFNRPRAIRDHNEKLAIGRFAQFIAPSLVTREPAELQAFVDAEGDVIVKPLDGMGGTSIFRVRRDDPNRNAILEAVGQQGARTVMVQRYLPEIAEGDKRVLLIAGEPVPYALARIPKAGETRGNLAAGASSEGRPLTERDRWIADQVGPELRVRGIVFAGLDVIGDYLTEVNITSPTCIRELDAQFGLDIAGGLMDVIAERLTAA